MSELVKKSPNYFKLLNLLDWIVDIELSAVILGVIIIKISKIRIQTKMLNYFFVVYDEPIRQT